VFVAAFGVIGEESHAAFELGRDLCLEAVVQRGFELIESLSELLDSIEFVLFGAEGNIFLMAMLNRLFQINRRLLFIIVDKGR